MFTMVGENFKNCISEMARNALKIFTIVGENFEICISARGDGGRFAPRPQFVLAFFGG